MKKQGNCLLILLIAFCCDCASAADDGIWGVATNGAQMSIQLSGEITEIMTNQPFSLMIRIKNISTNETFCVNESFPIEMDPKWSFKIISPSGTDVSPPAPKVTATTGLNRSVLPRGSQEFKFDLKKRCKFNEIGAYAITVKMKIWALEGRPDFVVTSNPLRLTVVPGEWKGVRTNNVPIHW